MWPEILLCGTLWVTAIRKYSKTNFCLKFLNLPRNNHTLTVLKHNGYNRKCKSFALWRTNLISYRPCLCTARAISEKSLETKLSIFLFYAGKKSLLTFKAAWRTLVLTALLTMEWEWWTSFHATSFCYFFHFVFWTSNNNGVLFVLVVTAWNEKHASEHSSSSRHRQYVTPDP